MHQRKSMSHEEAILVAAGDIVYTYDTAWKVVQTMQGRPDKATYIKESEGGPFFRVRLGKSGTMGHEHWMSWTQCALKPCCE